MEIITKWRLYVVNGGKSIFLISANWDQEEIHPKLRAYLGFNH